MHSLYKPDNLNQLIARCLQKLAVHIDRSVKTKAVYNESIDEFAARLAGNKYRSDNPRYGHYHHDEPVRTAVMWDSNFRKNAYSTVGYAVAETVLAPFASLPSDEKIDIKSEANLDAEAKQEAPLAIPVPKISADDLELEAWALIAAQVNPIKPQTQPKLALFMHRHSHPT